MIKFILNKEARTVGQKIARGSQANCAIDYPDVIKQSSKKLLADYETTRMALKHKGLKGAARENALVRFLSDYLPPQFKCVSGEVVSISGRSKQVDIVVCHSTRAPTLYSKGTTVVREVLGKQ